LLKRVDNFSKRKVCEMQDEEFDGLKLRIEKLEAEVENQNDQLKNLSVQLAGLEGITAERKRLERKRLERFRAILKNLVDEMDNDNNELK